MLMVADTADLEAVLLWISATLDLVTEERPELLMKERPGWMRLVCWASSLCTVPPDSGSTPAIHTRLENSVRITVRLVIWTILVRRLNSEKIWFIIGFSLKEKVSDHM